VRDGVEFDSLLVLFDCACRGAQYALMQHGLRIPEDVALLTHSNRGAEIFSHIPLTRLEVDPEDFAREVILEITRKIAGERYEPTKVKAELIPGFSCGEQAPPVSATPYMDAYRAHLLEISR